MGRNEAILCVYGHSLIKLISLIISQNNLANGQFVLKRKQNLECPILRDCPSQKVAKECNSATLGGSTKLLTPL